MMKWFFWCLLALNALLFAYSQGYLGNTGQARHEPARMLNEQNAAQLRLITPAQASKEQERARDATLAAAPESSTASAPDVAANEVDTKVDMKVDTKLNSMLDTRANKEKPPAPARIACLEIGNFDSADAKRFEARLSALALGERQSRRSVPGLDGSNKVSGYVVLIPPQASREGANKKARELEQLGVTNYYIMPDSSAQRWAISLGVFKLESGAEHLLEALQKQGVHSARIVPRMSNTSQLAFQLRDLDVQAKTRLDQIRLDFSEQQMRSCK